ncbi:tRNA (adenosine(37)-N6)-threonylcarbamoyltransferase complex dimerization subunit type 1 TsaB [Candidatus Nitrospira bockiana]
MKLLAVETATSRQSVALFDGETVVAADDRDAGGQHARYLVSGVDRLLARVGWRLTDLDALAASLGPGSFTGLRVGLATMMGFRMVTGLPIVGVPTLEAMAWNLRSESSLLCPMLRARAREVYWAFFRWERDRLQSVGPERVGSLEQAAASWPESPESAIVYGEGWEANREELTALLGSSREIREPRAAARVASAVSVGYAALRKLASGEPLERVSAPRYVQRAEAELVLERRKALAGT